MIRRVRSKKKTLLSDKIVSALEPQTAPDVEDDQIFGTKPHTVTSNDLDSDHESVEETTLSSFRKQATQLLSEQSDRYAGEVTSKKDLGLNDDNTDEDEEEGSFEEQTEDLNESEAYEESGDEEDEESDRENVSDNESEVGKSSDESDAEEVEDGFDLSQMGENGQSEFTHLKVRDNREDVLKGESVRNQLSLWERLLEARIGLQKCLIPANKLPLPETMTVLRKISDESLNPALDRTRTSLTTLLSKLLELQEALLSNYPETKNILGDNSTKKEDPMEEEITSESEKEDEDEELKLKQVEDKPPTPKRKRKLKDFSDIITERHSKLVKFRDDTIEKWNNKINITQTSNKNQQTNSVLSQIQYLLGDMNKLRRKTQLKRSQYSIIGMENNTDLESEEYCEEIFDDDDFYHQLLRELIEHKSSEISDPIQLSRQWIMLQQMRSKMKRKIDTRATKGRRIRYSVHPKLVNFMAPEPKLDWTEDAKNELFASIFGKQFETM